MRAVVATAEIVGFSAFAHGRAEGHLPPMDQLLWLALAVFGGTALMLCGRLRVRSIVVAATLLQGGLHFLYAGLASASATGHHGAVSHPTTTGLMPSRDMVIAHAVTAAVTALVLIVQEQAVRRLASLVELVLVRVRPSGEARRPVVPVLPVRFCSDLIILRRGPPFALSALTS